jgi:hypothetical protein
MDTATAAIIRPIIQRTIHIIGIRRFPSDSDLTIVFGVPVFPGAFAGTDGTAVFTLLQCTPTPVFITRSRLITMQTSKAWVLGPRTFKAQEFREAVSKWRGQPVLEVFTLVGADSEAAVVAPTVAAGIARGII